MSEDNTVDIFSRRKLSEIEEEQARTEEEEKERKRENLQDIIDLLQEMLDDDQIEGLGILCVGKHDHFPPAMYCDGMKSLAMLNLLCDSLKGDISSRVWNIEMNALIDIVAQDDEDY